MTFRLTCVQAKVADHQPAKTQHTPHVLGPFSADTGVASQPSQPDTLQAAAVVPSQTAQQPSQNAEFACTTAAANGTAADTLSKPPSKFTGQPPHADGPSLAQTVRFTDEQATENLASAPSPSSVAPQQRSALTNSLAQQHSTPPALLSAPMFSTMPDHSQMLSSSTKAAAPAASPAAVNMKASQSHAFAWSNSQQQQQQQESANGAMPEGLLTPVMANGIASKDAGQEDLNKAQHAGPSSSEASEDTSVNLYPFPTQRSAQDRLEGIVSSAPPAQDLQGLYVFGGGAELAEPTVPASLFVPVLSRHADCDQVPNPTVSLQVHFAATLSIRACTCTLH